MHSSYLSITHPSTTLFSYFFFFNDTATTEIYTLSLHDALPIFQAEENVIERLQRAGLISPIGEVDNVLNTVLNNLEDRKSTRLNSSHANISYAVFCLKKKKKKKIHLHTNVTYIIIFNIQAQRAQ